MLQSSLMNISPINPIQLTYVITTKNKLPFLKSGLEKLFNNKKKDEEILVADAASTDGSVEFLREAYKNGKINFLVSEPDFGESHALNKLFLIAKGELITIITDDDVFYFPTIITCREFMLSHPKIDIISTEGGSFNKTSAPLDEHPLQLIRALDYKEKYEKWQESHNPFSFCGLGIMFRRSSLPLLGLWDLSFRAADAEFSFRTTAGKVNLAWYTGYSFVNISNPQSTSLVFRDKIKQEIVRLNTFYLNKKPNLFILDIFNVLKGKFKKRTSKRTKESEETFKTRWPELILVAEKWLEIKNKEKKPEFLWNKK